MERSSELDLFLRNRRSATDAGAVVFENKPKELKADAVNQQQDRGVLKTSDADSTEKVFENSPISSTADAGNKSTQESSIPKSRNDIRGFWEKQSSNALHPPIPLHNGRGSGMTGIGLSQASISAATIQRPTNLQLPLTASTQLPYHGVKHQPKTRLESKEGFVSTNSIQQSRSCPSSPPSNEGTRSNKRFPSSVDMLDLCSKTLSSSLDQNGKGDDCIGDEAKFLVCDTQARTAGFQKEREIIICDEACLLGASNTPVANARTVCAGPDATTSPAVGDSDCPGSQANEMLKDRRSTNHSNNEETKADAVHPQSIKGASDGKEEIPAVALCTNDICDPGKSCHSDTFSSGSQETLLTLRETVDHPLRNGSTKDISSPSTGATTIPPQDEEATFPAPRKEPDDGSKLSTKGSENLDEELAVILAAAYLINNA